MFRPLMHTTLLAVLATTAMTQAQVPVPRTALSFGGAANEDAFNVALLNNGTAIVSGVYRAQGTLPGPGGSNLSLFVTNSSGLEDIFLAAYVPGRSHFEYVRLINGNDSQLGPGTLPLSDGNFIFLSAVKGRTFFSFGTAQQTIYDSGSISFDPTFARFTPNGALQFLRTVRGDFTNLFRSAAEGPNGSVVLIGNSRGRLFFAEGTPQETIIDAFDEFFDWFLCAYSASGTLLWAIPAAGALEDKVASLTKLPNGTFAAAGQFESSLTIGAGTPSARTINATAGFDLFVTTFDAEGTILTAHAFGTPFFDDMKSIIPLPDGDLFISAVMADAFDAPLTMRLVRMNPITGTIRWEAAPASAGTQSADAILYLPEWNRVLAAVQFTQTLPAGNAGTFTSRGGTDSAILVINPETGAIEDGIQIGGEGQDLIFGMARAGERRLLAVGSFTGTMRIGNGTPVPDQASRGGFDGFVLTFDLPVAPTENVGWFFR